MPVVRCSVHNVPYNDENPRGCPACWQDKVGKDPAGLMKELARASQAIPRVEILPPTTDDELPPMERLRTGAWPTPVTPPPRLPAPEPTRSERLAQTLRTHAVAVTSVGLVTVAGALMWYVSRPTFTPTLQPPALSGEALPFPVVPNTPILGAFALLGSQAPTVHPESPSLARYDFGEGTTVDAFNGVVYAVTLTSPRRSWQGNRVGADQVRARGGLALLGPVTEDEPAAAAPFPFAGYLAFRGLADLPAATMTARLEMVKLMDMKSPVPGMGRASISAPAKP